MSSSATETTIDGPAPKAGPGRRTLGQKSPKTASVAAAASEGTSTPSSASADHPASGSATGPKRKASASTSNASAPPSSTPKTTKKPKAPKASGATDGSASVPVPASAPAAGPAATVPDPIIKPKTVRSRGKAVLAAEAPPTDADPDQDPEGDTEGEGDAEGGSSSPSASPKRKSRKKAPKLDFLQAYGDLDTDVKDYSKQAFEAYKDGCRKIVEFMKFSDFVKTKKKFYRDLDIKYRQQKKKTKKENKEKTHEKYLQRLKEMPAEQFAKLDGKWLSNYGFDGKFSAEELAAGGCPVPEALPVYAVYQAALFHGVAPLGIVSEKTKKNAAGKPRQLFPVEGDDQPENEPNPIPKLRFYVGPALPYVYKTMSEFAATNKDRVNDADDAEDAAGSADADADGGEE